MPMLVEQQPGPLERTPHPQAYEALTLKLETMVGLHHSSLPPAHKIQAISAPLSSDLRSLLSEEARRLARRLQIIQADGLPCFWGKLARDPTARVRGIMFGYVLAENMGVNGDILEIAAPVCSPGAEDAGYIQRAFNTQMSWFKRLLPGSTNAAPQPEYPDYIEGNPLPSETMKIRSLHDPFTSLVGCTVFIYLHVRRTPKPQSLAVRVEFL
ncbi:hypothetical protein C8R46DRAFT_1042144 [Mycena filopes]|nr:hypothetical protein C8R46DRAFT_1042144 [Mycena filopes]